MAFHRILDGNRLYLGFVSGNMEVLRRGDWIDFKEGELRVRIMAAGPTYHNGGGAVLAFSEQMRRKMVDDGPIRFSASPGLHVIAVFGRTPKAAAEAIQKARHAL
jgi:hypothetical protein